GRTVGPKAANLGELHRLFPGKVAPALALPFGMFNEHISAGSPSLRDQMVAAYRARRAGEIDEAALLETLAEIRTRIASLTLTADARARVVRAMAAEFGSEPGYGLFIRSDTNVEDLPGFSGAGLSETVPNVVGMEQQLASVSQVWSSVLSTRSVAWRANLMKNPERIYASVLLMQSVPADKSGVLVTTDLVSYGKGLTVSTAWGIGGAVAGEVAETLVLLPGGGQRLIHEAKAPYRRALAPGGGIEWHAAPDGAVLTTDEKRQLRELVVAVERKYKPVLGPDEKPMPWDIEFGFVDGNLTLFQIRPLVERGYQRAARVVRLLAGGAAATEKKAIDLSASVAFPEKEGS
ncbi:MAG: phosphoenolpyruvate synthase, partial [Xanthomonadales bacterium]|nr:phosphoenolpyruvate synthase [Xanthomonadales bacterium]